MPAGRIADLRFLAVSRQQMETGKTVPAVSQNGIGQLGECLADGFRLQEGGGQCGRSLTETVKGLGHGAVFL